MPTLYFDIWMGKKFNLKNKAVGGSQRLIGCMWCSWKPMTNERRPFSFILEEAWVRPRMKTEPGVPTESGSTTFRHYDVQVKNDHFLRNVKSPYSSDEPCFPHCNILLLALHFYPAPLQVKDEKQAANVGVSKSK